MAESPVHTDEVQGPLNLPPLLRKEVQKLSRATAVQQSGFFGSDRGNGDGVGLENKGFP